MFCCSTQTLEDLQAWTVQCTPWPSMTFWSSLAAASWNCPKPECSLGSEHQLFLSRTSVLTKCMRHASQTYAFSILLKSHNALILCTSENYTDITLLCSGVCSSFATLSSLARKMHHATQSRRHNASCLSTWPIKQGKCGENHCIFLHPHLNCSAVLPLCIVLYTRQIIWMIKMALNWPAYTVM